MNDFICMYRMEHFSQIIVNEKRCRKCILQWYHFLKPWFPKSHIYFDYTYDLIICDCINMEKWLVVFRLHCLVKSHVYFDHTYDLIICDCTYMEKWLVVFTLGYTVWSPYALCMFNETSNLLCTSYYYYLVDSWMSCYCEWIFSVM